jgi:hypothetical protein
MKQHKLTLQHAPDPQDWVDETLVEALAAEHPLSADVLERHSDTWDWEKLSANEALPWSEDLIARFEDRWNWKKLSANEALP